MIVLQTVKKIPKNICFAYQVGPIPENEQRVSNVGSEDAPASDEIPLKNGIYRGDTTEIDDPNGGTTKVAQTLTSLCALSSTDAGFWREFVDVLVVVHLIRRQTRTEIS